jgi:hypothetical protein
VIPTRVGSRRLGQRQLETDALDVTPWGIPTDAAARREGLWLELATRGRGIPRGFAFEKVADEVLTWPSGLAGAGWLPDGARSTAKPYA